MEHKSYKFIDGRINVDLISHGYFEWDTKLIMELTLSHKDGNEHHVHRVLKELEAIRIVTDSEGVYERRSNYMRIGYPKALLMMSNDSNYDLLISKGVK
jgi:hypothetical protein